MKSYFNDDSKSDEIPDEKSIENSIQTKFKININSQEQFIYTKFQREKKVRL